MGKIETVKLFRFSLVSLLVLCVSIKQSMFFFFFLLFLFFLLNNKIYRLVLQVQNYKGIVVSLTRKLY